MSPLPSSKPRPKKTPDRATLKRAIKGLQRVLERSPEDVRSFVRLARAYRLLGEITDSASWYRRAIDGYSAHDSGLKALALAKELIAVDPSNHQILLEMARLYARLPQGERGPGRVATPITERDDTVAERIPREFTATSARALEILDDPAEVERVEPEMRGDLGSAGAAGPRLQVVDEESKEAKNASEEAPSIVVEEPDDSLEGPRGTGEPEPPPPPAEAFLVDDVDDEPGPGEIFADPAWTNELEPEDRRQSPESRADESTSPVERKSAAPISPPRSTVLASAKMGDLPLLSSLGETAFVTISEAMRPLALRDGERLFSSDEDARSFFIIASGIIEARVPTKDGEATIASLGEGEVLGLFGLYSGRRRNATAVAQGSALVFEITDRVLAKLIREHPASKKPLAAFYRKRLLELSLGRSPLFRDLPRDKRLAVVDRFETRRFASREAVIAPGQVTLGLHLMIRGKVEIKTRDTGMAKVVATLERGQFFGCISALTGMPTLASAELVGDGILAVLPHRTFSDLLRLQPELSTLPRRLREEKLLITSTIFVGDPAAAATANQGTDGRGST